MPATDPATPTPPRSAAVSAVASGVHTRGMFRGMDQAYLMQGDLLAAIAVWAGLGWLLDRALGTPEVFLVVGSLVGYAAGVYLIWLRSERMDADERAATEAPGDAPGDVPGDTSREIRGAS